MSKLFMQSKTLSDLSMLEVSGRPEDVAMKILGLHTNVGESKIGAPRASSLYGACMRLHALAAKRTINQKTFLDVGTMLTFGIGKAVHRWIQNSGDILGDNRWGRWICLACGEISGFRSAKKARCPKCDAGPGAFEYYEYDLKTGRPYVCSGHPDMFIRVGEKLRVVEIKTIAATGFKITAYPGIEHQWQLQFYAWASGKDPILKKLVDPTVGYVLYVSKGALFSGIPFKMFAVNRDEKIIEQIMDKLGSYDDAITGGTLPQTLENCKLGFEVAAKNNCPAAKYCMEAGD
jgi:hypothetical protein